MAEPQEDKQKDEAENLREIRVRRDSPALGTRDAFLELKNKLHGQILKELDPAVELTQKDQVRPYVHDRLNALMEDRGIILNRSEKRQLHEAIVFDLMNA